MKKSSKHSKAPKPTFPRNLDAGRDETREIKSCVIEDLGVYGPAEISCVIEDLGVYAPIKSTGRAEYLQDQDISKAFSEIKSWQQRFSRYEDEFAGIFYEIDLLKPPGRGGE